MKKLLTIDLSTTSTGWAVFDLEKRQLEDYGFIKPEKKGLSKLSYPEKQLKTMQSIGFKLMEVIYRVDGFAIDGSQNLLKTILIEEVNRHKSRMTGKTLDGMHWVLMEMLAGDNDLQYIKRVKYRDSDGPTGWRSRLNLRLGENDKKLNAERKKINKKKVKGTADLPIINKKHLAARYVNSQLGLSFDVDKNATDNDVVDAIGIGLSELLTTK
jgi:hypothetical protein